MDQNGCGLNIKTETLNLLEDKIGETLEDIGVGKDFLKTYAKIPSYSRKNGNH